MQENRLMITAACAMLLGVATLEAAEIRVPADQASVVAAYNAATAGDTILVQSTFSNTASLTISKNISIVSTDATYTTPTPGANIGGLVIQGGEIVLDGLTIGQNTGFQAAILVQSAATDLTLQNCTVTNVEDFGIQVLSNASGSSFTFTDTNVVNNLFAGIRFDSDCTNMSLTADGLNASNNGQDGLIFLYGTPGMLNNHVIDIQNSTFNGNGVAVNFGFAIALGQKPVTGTPAVVANCTMENNLGPGLFIGWEADHPEEPSVFNVSNCEIHNNFRGLDFFALENTTINLSDINITGSEQFAIFGDVLTPDPLSGIPTTVINAQDLFLSQNSFDGLYAGQGDWNFLRTEFVDNFFGLVVPFQVNDRNLTFEDCTFSNNTISGAAIEGPQNLTFTNCVFSGNGANGLDAGSLLLPETKEPELFSLTLDGCEIMDNGGIGLWLSAMDMDVTIVDCEFANNGATPFAIEAVRGSVATEPGYTIDVQMERSIFRGASAQSAHVSGTTWTAINCVFDEGSVTVAEGDPVFNDSIVMIGGGIEASLINCTLVDSPAGIDVAAAINVVNGTLNLQNSIISTTNAAVRLDALEGVAGTIDYNLYQAGSLGLTTGGANSLPLGTNPLFVTASTGVGTGNFALQSGSPAINAANPAVAPMVDIVGATRPEGSGPDIGAYEATGVVPSDSSDYFGIF